MPRFCSRSAYTMKVTTVTGVVGLSLLSVTAFATVPHNPSRVLDGCSEPPVRSLRVADPQAEEACGGSEGALTWNQEVSQAQPGPNGATGPQGPPGLGDPSRLVMRFGSGDFAPGKATATVDAYCGRGESAISGGFNVNHPGAIVRYSKMLFEGVNDTGRPRGWTTTVDRPDVNVKVGRGIVTYVYCLPNLVS